ncbi:MAG: hypothetical protein CL816_01100, partial [Coxiellaceae bacterium]|nr:hypothetical protein [Coxiellaceae bacterium]
QAAVAKKGPYLIHQESDVIIRAIRDYLRQDIEEIIIDEASAYERAQAYIHQIRPDFLSNLKLYTDHFPLFSRYQVEQQIENAYQHEVQLPSGGSIVIDHTEALVAIDINSARATKGGNIEETAFHTNKEAAQEIARQMRIRDIGGLIVIDFIDMSSSSHQREVENTLRESMSLDRARIQIGRISRFGLLELSRQRIRSALVKTTQNICKSCDGRGIIRSVESLSLAIIHMIQEHAAKTSSGQLQVQLPIEVATYIMNEKRDTLQSIKEHSQLDVMLIPNPHIHTPHYDFKVLTNPKASQAASYKLVQIPKPEANTKRSVKAVDNKEPAINQFLSSPGQYKNQTNSHKKQHEGVIKRLWGMMFGSEDHKPTPPKQNSTPAKPSASSRAQKNTNKPAQDSSNTRRGNRGGNTRKTPSKNPNSTARKKPTNKSSKPNPRSPQSRQRHTEKNHASTSKKVDNKSVPKNKPAEQLATQEASDSLKKNISRSSEDHVISDNSHKNTPQTAEKLSATPQNTASPSVSNKQPVKEQVRESINTSPDQMKEGINEKDSQQSNDQPSSQAVTQQPPIKKSGTKPSKSALQSSSHLQQVKTVRKTEEKTHASSTSEKKSEDN